MNKHKVCFVGSGNMGSTMAKVIGENIVKLNDFDPTVRMYVYDEQVDAGDGKGPRSLVEIINEKHENVKYLKGIPLPENVIAIADLSEAVEGCDFLVFVTPHQFIPGMIPKIQGHIPENASGISMIKGVTIKGDQIEFTTDLVENLLHIPCGGFMGANIAKDIANEDFIESTIAFRDRALAEQWLPLFNNSYLRVRIIDDLVLQQLCGTIKNIIATGAGFIDGLGMGQSTKAAILRIGLIEMYKFAQLMFPDCNCKMETLLESCGVADLICTSYGGRNRLCAEEFVKTGEEWSVIEARNLNGQKLQGVPAAYETFNIIFNKKLVREFPLMSTIYMIADRQVEPKAILDYDGEHLDNAVYHLYK